MGLIIQLLNESFYRGKGGGKLPTFLMNQFTKEVGVKISNCLMTHCNEQGRGELSNCLIDRSDREGERELKVSNYLLNHPTEVVGQGGGGCQRSHLVMKCMGEGVANHQTV